MAERRQWASELVRHRCHEVGLEAATCRSRDTERKTKYQPADKHDRHEAEHEQKQVPAW